MLIWVLHAIFGYVYPKKQEPQWFGQQQVEAATFAHTKKILRGNIGVVFYDMTTLYFEASQEDDFRITGYSKDGKHQQPHIVIGLLAMDIREGHPVELQHPNGRLIITYFGKRAGNDKANRTKGLKRLEKKVNSGKLSKKHINNRGYNKYLKLAGNIDITIDYEKFEADSAWDGLKGYVTNTTLTKRKVIENYGQLRQIKKGFRISQTDLRIRPVYHRIKYRIESHLCICFSAYTVYKELERILKSNNIDMSPEKAINEIKQIRQLQYVLPKSGQVKTKLLRLNPAQTQLMNMKF